jgi:hypothetical protein
LTETSRSNAIKSIVTAATVFSLLLLAVFFSIRQLSSPDIGFHVKAGEWILKNFRFPSHDMFTYTVSAHAYIDTYWLYQVVVATANSIAGVAGIVLSNTLILVASFVVLMIRMSRYVRFRESITGLALLFLAIFATAVIFEPRPHTFSWLYLGLILWILEEHGEGNSRFLVLLPVVMVLWVNTHTTFVLGWIVIGCFWIGSVWEQRRIRTRLTAYALASVAVTILNPYGWKGVLVPFTQVRFLTRADVFKGVIAEYASPLDLSVYHVNGAFTVFQPLLGFHVFFVVLVLVFLFNIHRMRLHEILLSTAFLFVGVSGIKNLGYCVFAMTPLLMKGKWPRLEKPDSVDVKGRYTRIIQRGKEVWESSWMVSASRVIIIAIASVLILAVVTDRYYVNYRSNERFGLGYNNLTLPYQASLFLRDHHLDGKILNHFNFGGFLIEMIPQKIAIDGRNEVFGEKFYTEFSEMWDANDKKPILQKFDPDIIIFPPLFEFAWVDQLRHDPSWRLVYVDEVAAIYLRAGYAPIIPPIGPEDVLRTIPRIDESKINAQLKRDYPVSPSWWSTKRVYFPQREIGLSTFCFYNGWYDAACQVALNGLGKATVPCPELYFDLGNFFFEMRQANRAEYCYSRFLRTNNDSLAIERVKFLKRIMAEAK